MLYPRMKGDLVAHDSFLCKKFPDGSRPFPTQRVNGTYIGNYMSVFLFLHLYCMSE